MLSKAARYLSSLKMKMDSLSYALMLSSVLKDGQLDLEKLLQEYV